MKEHHSFVPFPKLTRIPWKYCTKCGLIKLRNKSTDKAVKLGCDWKDHEK